MKRVLSIGAGLSLAACLSFAAAIPSNNIYGDYVEARTADVYTGPCFANGEVEMNGKEAVFGWKINNGSWKGVNLQGLGIVGVVVTIVVIIYSQHKYNDCKKHVGHKPSTAELKQCSKDGI